MTKPKTLEQLRADKEQAETQLAQEQHKLERLENRKKYLEQGVQAATSAEAKKITQPSGAATPRDSDTHKRIAVPKALCVLRERLRPRPKSGKVCRSDTRPGDVRERAARVEGNDSAPTQNATYFGVCTLVCDFSRRAECVPAFAHESERGAFVPEVLKTVWTMCWKRWYDCVSCAFHGFFEDEKESRIKGWRRNRRRSRHFCPQCGQLTWVSTQSVVASFEGNFRAAGVLVPANAGVPRILVVPCGRFGRKSR